MNDNFKFFPQQNESGTTEARSAAASWQTGVSFFAEQKDIKNNPFFLKTNYIQGCQGVWGGGYTGVGSITLNILSMSTKTSASIPDVLSQGRAFMCAVGNSSHALFCGGARDNGSFYVNTDKFTWQTKTCSAQASANLPAASALFPTGVSNPEWSLQYGGVDGAQTKNATPTVRTTWYPTFIASLIPSANLIFDRQQLMSACDLNYSVFFGGAATNKANAFWYANTAEKVDWQSFTTRVCPSANLVATPRYSGSSVWDKNNVFVVGGGIDAVSNIFTNVADKMLWSTMTTIAYPSANSSAAHVQLSSLNGENEGIIANSTVSYMIHFATGCSAVINAICGAAAGNTIGTNS